MIPNGLQHCFGCGSNTHGFREGVMKRDVRAATFGALSVPRNAASELQESVLGSEVSNGRPQPVSQGFFGRFRQRLANDHPTATAAASASASAAAAVPPPIISSEIPNWAVLAGDSRWMPDDKCTVCFQCHAPFGAFRRRHHCRLCGQIYCHACSSHFVAGKLIGRPREKESRLCDACTSHCAGLPLLGRTRRPRVESPPNRRAPRVDSSSLLLADGFHATEEGDPSALRGGERSDGNESGETDEYSDSLECPPDEDARRSFRWYQARAEPFDASEVPSNAALLSGQPAAAYDLAALPMEFEERRKPQESFAAHYDAWRKLTGAAVEHFVRLVRDKCLSVGLEETVVALSICELAQQVVDNLRPRPGDDMDIMSYVKIKRIPGGNIRDSQCIDGVIFSRDVAHRKMRNRMPNCNLALLSEPLCFDGDHRLTSLDVLRKQESDLFDIKVKKIVDLQPMPELLICQGGVSQLAQERLRSKSITLVQSVPSHILDAIARCTGAKVISSVDSIVRMPPRVVGECSNFQVQQLGDFGSKALTVIEGSLKHRCCTVCLRGGATGTLFLTRAKKALQWAIGLARHLQLESEFLFENWCDPWPRVQRTEDDLDIISYIVSQPQGERSCSPPVTLHITPYAACPSQPREEGTEAERNRVYDLTLQDWLSRCFTTDAAPRIAEVLPHDISTETASSGTPVDTEAGVVRTTSTYELTAKVVNPKQREDLPVPRKGEVLYFQHMGNRVAVELDDYGSEREDAVTRWSLVASMDDDSRDTKDESKEGSIVMWRYCKFCKRPVTSRSALSTSVGWMSMAKFLELILHNSTSVVTSGGTEQQPCPHAAFRNHVLFFASPQNGLFVAFKWEQVHVWHLETPFFPFWDADTHALSNSTDPDVPTSAVLDRAADVIKKTNSLMRSILAALSKDPGPEHPWLSGWVLDNSRAWHHLLSQLVTLEKVLRHHLARAKDLLSEGTHDPMLCTVVECELLASLAQDPSFQSMNAWRNELASLIKHKHAPGVAERLDALPQPSVSHDLEDGAKRGAELIAENVPLAAPRQRAGSTQRSTERVRTRRTTSAGCVAEQALPLPAQLHDVWEATEELGQDGQALDGALYKLNLPVREDDVGSIISHALLSTDVALQMRNQWSACSGSKHCPIAKDFGEQACCWFSLPTAFRSRTVDLESLKSSHVPHESTLTATLLLSRTTSNDLHSVAATKMSNLPWHWVPEPTRPWEDEWARRGIRNTLVAPLQEPIHVEFTDQAVKYSVAIHHAPQYHNIRHWLCGDDLNFVRSLHRCTRINPSGGKSGAAFFVSHDRRFLLKAVNKYEFRMLTKQAEALFWHMDKVLWDKLPSMLAQVVGVFTVCVTRGQTKVSKRNFIVQSNLRYCLRSRQHNCFDLKGVGKSRRVAHSAVNAQEDEEEEETNAEPAEDTSKTVLWDQNFREWTQGRPLSLRPHDLQYLQASITNDTLLLSNQSLVDYSLLLAVAPGPGHGTLALGIIDYLRPYTLDKRMETVVKSAWHQGNQPTIIEPFDYARRFEGAMNTIFVADNSVRVSE